MRAARFGWWGEGWRGLAVRHIQRGHAARCGWAPMRPGAGAAARGGDATVRRVWGSRRNGAATSAARPTASTSAHSRPRPRPRPWWRRRGEEAVAALLSGGVILRLADLVRAGQAQWAHRPAPHPIAQPFLPPSTLTSVRSHRRHSRSCSLLLRRRLPPLRIR